jgi:hypothetical protein
MKNDTAENHLDEGFRFALQLPPMKLAISTHSPI